MRLNEIDELSDQVGRIRAALGDAVDLGAVIVKDPDGDGDIAVVATEDGLYLRSVTDDWPLVTGPSVLDDMRPWDIVRHGLQGSVGWGDGAPGPGATVFRALPRSAQSAPHAGGRARGVASAAIGIRLLAVS